MIIDVSHLERRHRWRRYDTKRSRYREYNSTTSCSFTGRAISSLVGSSCTRPVNLVLSSSNHVGTPRPSTPSNAFWMGNAVWGLSRIQPLCPTATKYDGMFTFFPL